MVTLQDFYNFQEWENLVYRRISLFPYPVQFNFFMNLGVRKQEKSHLHLKYYYVIAIPISIIITIISKDLKRNSCYGIFFCFFKSLSWVLANIWRQRRAATAKAVKPRRARTPRRPCEACYNLRSSEKSLDYFYSITIKVRQRVAFYYHSVWDDSFTISQTLHNV